MNFERNSARAREREREEDCVLPLDRSEREKKIAVDAVARVEQRFIVLRALSPCFTLFLSVVNSVLYFSFT